MIWSYSATPGYENCTAIGFLAHMDTAPDYSGENVNPQIIENYDGKDVVLGTSGRTLTVKDFSFIKKYDRENIDHHRRNHITWRRRQSRYC